MEMPKPTEAHARLAAFAGRWRGEEILYPSPWEPTQRTAVGRFDNRIGVDGMYLITDYEEERDGVVVFRGHGVYGWDPKRERYTMFWFDSMGFTPNEALGGWEGDTLRFTAGSDHGHGRYTYELLGDDRYRFTLETSRDGEAWTPMMTGTYARVPD